MRPHPPEMHARAAALEAAGTPRHRIAKQLGVGIYTIYRWLAPDFAEASRAISRSVKERYRGECVDCGKPTTGSNGPGTAAKRCVRCAGSFRTVWTPDVILEAIKLYADRYGLPPSARDWNPAMARAQYRDDIADRFYEDGCWPSAATVLARFGRWNDAIRAAGFEPLAQGRKYVDGQAA